MQDSSRATHGKKLMHSTDTKRRFIERRAQGWNLARNAAHLEVPKRALVDWNQHAQTIAPENCTVSAPFLHQKQGGITNGPWRSTSYANPALTWCNSETGVRLTMENRN